MKFWQLLRWIGGVLVLVVVLLACVATLFSAQQASDPAQTPELAVTPSVQPSNNRGL